MTYVLIVLSQFFFYLSPQMSQKECNTRAVQVQLLYDNLHMQARATCVPRLAED